MVEGFSPRLAAGTGYKRANNGSSPNLGEAGRG
jgi:hypothetical protein